MLCDVCGKNEATVHLTEIVNDKVTKLNLCETCAREKSAKMEEHFGLGELLAGLGDFGDVAELPKKAVKIKCSNCGLTYSDFRRTGRLGCSECYTAFQSKLEPLLKRIHGSDQHVGKTPSMKQTKVVTEPVSKLQEMKAKLKRAIDTEEFEEAAKIRDEIRELEKKDEKKDKEKKEK
ncbi:MAG: hypothetical protein COS99_01930 [Candidatus Omnitrophica bacterium CG07_land_8_20_14_0_80_42_15]|uniref:UVR domain-containing protein n=1 Tax=Candidatus Aquitaenariimonas noxiae TaxID=1974741 RepID=A0A2J0KUQ5_9BACT|nr:MAG: hypothetical protein COS99_01930 [Candidatus Omnitrophica bacterium CG07_land_8_20_14_0_80_42_15]